MKTETVSLVRLEPSSGMCLKNIRTGEMFRGFIYLAKSLDINDFEEISAEEYEKIIGERSSEE